MNVYLGGPINGCTDDEATGWRDKFRALLPEAEFIDPMVRDYRGREDECVDEIVELDKQDIDEADVLLAYCWQPSWGTAMEIMYAHMSYDPFVIVVVPDGQRVSPWLRYHGHVVSTLEEAAATIRYHWMI